MMQPEHITIAGFKTLGSRDAYGVALVALGKAYPNLYVLTADCTSSVRAELFAKEFPERLINVGIAEQNLVSIAAGLAIEGKLPFVTGFAMVMSMRACEQVRSDIAYPKLNVKIIGTHSGLSMGPSGTSHHCTEDIAIMRSMANMTVVVPADGLETARAAYAMAAWDGPVYMRLGRSFENTVSDFDYSFELGKAVVVREGSDVTLIACGEAVFSALEAAKILAAENLSSRVLNMHTIKPIDQDAIRRAALETAGIVSVEVHNIFGGLGSAISEVVAEECLCPVRKIGVPDIFAGTGTAELLREKLGITPKAIANAAKTLIELKKSRVR